MFILKEINLKHFDGNKVVISGNACKIKAIIDEIPPFLVSFNR